MNILFIGKHKYPKDIFSNEQDLKTWRSLSVYFGRLFVIAQSPDLFFHSGQEKNIQIYLVPRLGYAVFIKCAVILGLYLKLRFGIDVFDASEVTGGGMAVTILKFLTGKPSVIEIQGEIFRKSGDFNNANNTNYNANDTNYEYNKKLAISGISNRLLNWHYYKNLFLQKIGRFVMKKANRIRVISRAIFNQVKEQGIEENKIRLVSLRVDLNQFDPLSILRIDSFGGQKRAGAAFDGRKSAPEKIRNQFFDRGKVEKYTEDFQMGIIIGYIGRLIDSKGLEDLIIAVSKLKIQMSNFRILIFGVGPLETKLKDMAKNFKIADKIEWQGFIPYSKVPEALSQIDIFVYPSWHEGFGRSIMEALAMGKAVVATRVGGIPDLIKDNENGFLVSPHNPQELAQKIKMLMENKELREKFGKVGREWVSKNFEWNDGIKKFANLFLELK